MTDTDADIAKELTEASLAAVGNAPAEHPEIDPETAQKLGLSRPVD